MKTLLSSTILIFVLILSSACSESKTDQAVPSSDESKKSDQVTNPDDEKTNTNTETGTDECVLEDESSTWSALHQLVISEHGCTGCHGGAVKEAKLDLSSAEIAYNSIFNKLSSRLLSEPLHLVYPGEQAKSLLYLKMEARTLGKNLENGLGKPMPPKSFDAVSKEHLEAMRLWIRAGAPKTGIVEGTPELLKCGIKKDADPNKIPPLAKPKKGEGVQFIAGPWTVKAESEDEVCFVTYYDLTKDFEQVPQEARVDCAGEKDACMAINSNLLAQDPQSHHSLNYLYTGDTGIDSPKWGAWRCRGGENDGKTCDPGAVDVSVAAGGGNCGQGSVCGTEIKSSLLCTGYGPGDLNYKQLSINGAQTPISNEAFPEGVYRLLPLKGIIIWNSHGFNLTKKDSTIEQYFNLGFAPKDQRKYLKRRIFEAKHLLKMNVEPFETQELCGSYTVPKGGYLIHMNSHVHKRGSLFRVWGPPNETDCKPENNCKPNDREPIYISTIYDDPVDMVFENPIPHMENKKEDRTYKYCAVFDNGKTDIADVKRWSKSKGISRCNLNDTKCIGGPNQGKVCAGKNAVCDSSEGAGDGDCDACLLKGGFTTEDEMFIFLGSFYKK